MVAALHSSVAPSISLQTCCANTTAIVLAGGQGMRMHGKNKGLVTFLGKPLVWHVLNRIAPQVGHVVISANRDLAAYAHYAYPIITDKQHDACGPLAGIVAALTAVQTEYVLIVPCDTPFLPGDLVVRLASSMIEQDTALAVAHDGERMQPLVALMRRKVAAAAQDLFDAGDRTVKTWLLTHAPTVVGFTDQPAAFQNMNSDMDLALATMQYQAHRG